MASDRGALPTQSSEAAKVFVERLSDLTKLAVGGRGIVRYRLDDPEDVHSVRDLLLDLALQAHSLLVEIDTTKEWT